MLKHLRASKIIRKAERQLLNECVRSINNTLELFVMKRDTCIQELKDTILDKEDDQKTFEECSTLIKRVMECWHNRVMQRQKQKFEALQQKTSGRSNKGQQIGRDNMALDISNWVKNLSDPTFNNRTREVTDLGAQICYQAQETSSWRICSSSGTSLFQTESGRGR